MNLKPIRYVVNLENSLTALSFIALGSLLLTSLLDGHEGGDWYIYHLPFAARLWGIVTPEQYSFSYIYEHRFLGFPLLVNYLQGFFWLVFQKPEAANLVCFLSFVIFIIFLNRYLKIPFYLATLSLLAVPMVHMHATKGYIDLPGNVAVAILILMTYLLYANQLKLNKSSLVIIILSAVFAANTKHQLVPITFIILAFLLAFFIINNWQNNQTIKDNLRSSFKPILIFCVALPLVFTTTFKNIILYQNPFYPVKVEIAGIVLNHIENQPDFIPENLKKLPPPMRWLKSILEMDAFDSRRPRPWTLGMDYLPLTDARFGLGGYFGGYVIFNLMLFIYICWKLKNIDSKIAMILMVIMTIFTSLMPQSYELRYYLYWMIVFIAINNYLTCSLFSQTFGKSKLINPKMTGLIAMAFTLVFIQKTHFFYTRPSFLSIAQSLQNSSMTRLDPKILAQIHEGDRVCLLDKFPYTFLYSSYFHPPLHYSVKAESSFSEEFIQKHCGSRKIFK